MLEVEPTRIIHLDLRHDRRDRITRNWPSPTILRETSQTEPVGQDGVIGKQTLPSPKVDVYVEAGVKSTTYK